MKQVSLCFAIISLAVVMLVPKPCKAYDDDTHFLLTYVLAREAGYTPEQARRTAMACLGVDTSPYTEPLQLSLQLTPYRRPIVHWIQKRFHSLRDSSQFTNPIEADLDRARQLTELGEEAFQQDNPGMYFHAFEDSYAHDGYWSGIGHLLAWHDADYLSDDPQKSMTMAKATVMKLRSYLASKAATGAVLQGPIPRIDNGRVTQMTQMLIDANPVAWSAPNYGEAQKALRELLEDVDYVPGRSSFNFWRGMDVDLNGNLVETAPLSIFPNPNSYASQKFTLWTDLHVQLRQIPNKAGITYEGATVSVRIYDKWPNRDSDDDGTYLVAKKAITPGANNKLFAGLPVSKAELVIEAKRPDIAPYVNKSVNINLTNIKDDEWETYQKNYDWSVFSFDSAPNIQASGAVIGRLQAYCNIKSSYPNGSFISSVRVPYGSGTLRFTFGPVPDAGGWRRARFSRYGWNGFTSEGPVTFAYVPAQGSGERGYSGSGTGRFILNKNQQNGGTVQFNVTGTYRQQQQTHNFSYNSAQLTVPDHKVGCGPFTVFFVW